jgi:hypothetical protein
MMMKMHGLGDGAYWLVTYTWFSVLYIAYMAVFIAFGSLIGLNMFTKNSMGVQVRGIDGGSSSGRAGPDCTLDRRHKGAPAAPAPGRLPRWRRLEPIPCTTAP